MSREDSSRRARSRRNRRILFESLEPRRLLAAAWRNPADALDVNQDQRISPLDPLVVINDLNRNGARLLEPQRPSEESHFYDVNGDSRITPLDALQLINALNRGRSGGYALGEGSNAASEMSVTIGLGQPEGSRTYRFAIDADFDTSDPNSAVEDTLAVYLRDPLDPAKTVLAGGRPGGALFTLAGSRAEYAAGAVRFDGSVVEIDLTEVEGAEAGELVFQLINSDDDRGSSVILHSLANVVDPEGAAAEVVAAEQETVAAAGALDVPSLTSSDEIQLDVTAIQFDSSRGEYRAAVRARNLGTAVGRNVAVVLPGLPEGVTLRNRSGTTAAGHPYLNLRHAIAAGGLGQNARSGYVELVIDTPTLKPFSLDAEVWVGEPNGAPTLQPIAPLTVTAGDVVELSLNATDPDGDRLQFGLVPAPTMPTTRMRNNGTLVFSPSPSQLGTYQFNVFVRDGLERVEQTVELTVVADPLTTTRVAGRVLDVDGTPLAGMLVEIGAVQALTDDEGVFTLDLGSGPLVSDTLKIRGDQYDAGEGVAYPFIAERLPLMLEHEVFSGARNVIPRPIYLPKLDIAGGSSVDPNVATTVAQEFAPGETAEVFVEAGTLMNLQGTPFDGVLSITEVPPSLTPAALPENMLADTVVTIQPGEMVFSTPAPLTLPNRAGWAPGTLMDLMSINPTTGEFEIAGKGRVSDDGSVIETIEDGIRNSSWHFFTPDPPEPQDPEENPRNEDPECDPCGAGGDFTSEVQFHSGAVMESHALPTYQSLGVSRGVRLTYDSLRADPRPIVHAGYSGVTQSDSLRLVSRLTIERNDIRVTVPGYQPQARPEGVPERIGVSGRFREALLGDPWTEIREHTQAFDANAGQYLAIQNIATFPSYWLNIELTAPDGTSIPTGTGEPILLPQSGSYTVTVTPSYYPEPGNELHFSFELVDVSHLNLAGGEHLFAVRGGDNEIAMQADMSGLPTGKYDYTLSTGLLQLTDAGFAGTMSPSRGSLYHVNSVSSAVGAGWGIAGLQEIVENPDGSLLLIDGDGRELIYKTPPTAGAPYQSTPGDFSVMERTAEGVFQRTMHDQTVYLFNADNQLASITDRNGNRTEYVYSGKNLIKMIDPVGLETTFEYENGKLVRITDPAERTTTLEHDASGNLTRIVDPDGSARTFAYDAQHHLTSEIDQRGNREETLYGFHGRATGAIRKDGTEVRVQPVQVQGLMRAEATIDPLNPPLASDLGEAEAQYVAANGNARRTIVDQRGQAVAAMDSLGALPTVERDPESNLVTTRIDARGNATRFTYDVHGNLLSVADGISLTAAGETFASDFTPNSVVLGDVNGDGREDALAVGQDESDNSIVVVLVAQGSGAFAAPRLFSVGQNATDLAVGDLDGDGAIDVVTANRGNPDSSVSVLIGDGEGGFGNRVDYATGAYPSALRLFDTDGDGALDIVTANSAASSVSVLLGRGDGSFPGPIARTGESPTAQVAADLNGDGVVDIVTANGSYDTVPGASLSVLIGDGDGSFTTSEVSLGTDEGSLRALAAGDVNGDGAVDIVVADDADSGGLAVLLGTGSGGLTANSRTDLEGRYLSALALADMDGDGTLDVVATTGSALLVLLGSGEGTFSAPLVEPGAWGSLLALGDVNGDGSIDAVLGSTSNSSVELRLGAGDGTFTDPSYVPVGGSIGSFDLLDFDGDGNLDLVGDFRDGELLGAAVLLGAGDGTFALASADPATVLSEEVGDTLAAALTVNVPSEGRVRLQSSIGDNSFGSSDVDLYRVELTAGEGFVIDVDARSIELSSIDSILRVFDSSGTPLYSNDDTADLDPALRFTVPEDGVYYVGVSSYSNFGYDPTVPESGSGWSTGDYQLTLSRAGSLPGDDQRTRFADVDGDGFVDAVTFASEGWWGGSSSLWFQAGQSDGTLAPPVETPLEYAVEVDDFRLADLDGDGILDVFAAWSDGNRIVQLAGQFGGGFAPFSPRSADVSVGSWPVALAIGDLNGDGIADVVTGNDASVSVLIGAGGGAFGEPLELALAAEVEEVAIGDLDGDGVADLVAALGELDRVAVFIGKGDGSFEPRREYAVGGEPVGLSLLDSDGDGDLDVVAANEEDASLTVLRNNGDGTFPGLVLHTGGSANAVAAGDLDGDGVDDLVTANEEGTVSVLLGGSGSYALAADYSLGENHQALAVAVADVNQDGRADVVVAATEDYWLGRIAVLLGNGDGSLGSPRHFEVGQNPIAVEVGDVNGDGAIDIVAASDGYSDSAVSVLIGDGDGSFSGRVDYAVGNEPESLELIDVDSNGALDIVTANAADDSVSVLLGRGDGTFPGRIARTADEPIAHRTVDLNGDGVLDLITANTSYESASGASLSVAMGRGDGSFETPTHIALELAAGSLRDFDAADLDGDGAVELVVLDESQGGGLTVLRGNGGGEFTIQDRLPLAGYGHAVILLRDIDSDGARDAIIGTGSELMVLLGSGDGTFADPLVENWVWVDSMAIGEVTGDGRLDVVVAAEGDSSIVVWPGGAEPGTFGDAQEILLQGSVQTFQLADADGDGLLDIVANVQNGDLLGTEVHLGRGDGTFAEPPRSVTSFDFDAGPVLSTATRVDLPLAGTLTVGSRIGDNADGSSDVDLYRVELSAGEGFAARVLGFDSFEPLLRVFDDRGNEISQSNDFTRFAAPADGFYYLGVSDISHWTYDPEVAGGSDGGSGVTGLYGLSLSRLASLPSVYQKTAVGDLDGDGHLDVITLAPNSTWDEGSSLWFEAGQEDGTFAAPVETPLEYRIETNELSLVDVDGDGDLDLLGSWREGDRVLLMAGDGTGKFAPFDRRAADIPAGEWSGAVAAGDLDGDGMVDLVTGNYQSVSVLRGQGGGGFDAVAELPATGYVEDVVLGDLNGDAIPDIVVALESVDRIAVFLADGAGGYQPRREYAMGEEPVDLSLLDSDGDGDLDIVAANEEQASVTMLRNNGDGTFPGAVQHSGGYAYGLASGDVNRDGVEDLIAVNNDNPSLSVLLGNGQGVYEFATRYSVGDDVWPTAVTLADLNQDGHVDLVSSGYHGNSGGAVSVLLGQSDGTFGPASNTLLDTMAGAVAAGDVNGDRILDIVTTNQSYSDSSVHVLLGAGDGSFSSSVEYAVGTFPESLRLADLDGDGVLDIVTANAYGDSVSVLRGRGDGTFPGRIDRTGPAPVAHLSVDLNGDGIRDVVTANGTYYGTTGLTLSVLLGRGDGGFTATDVSLDVDLANPSGLAADDLDGNGTVDVVVVAVDGTGSGRLIVLSGDGDGGLTTQRRFRLGNVYPLAVSLEDLDGDGASDAIVSTTGVTLVFAGNGEGTFGSPESTVVRGSMASIEDLDGDGALDLVTSWNQQAQLHYGNGDRTFAPAVSVPLSSSFNFPVTSLVVADATGDGIRDLIAAMLDDRFLDDATGRLVVLAGAADGSFADPIDVTLSEGTQPVALASEDIDGDGDFDLVLLGSTQHGFAPHTPLSVLINEGNGAFQPSLEINVDGSVDDLTTGDFDGDGVADLLLRSMGGRRVVVMRGDGAGGFAPLDPRDADLVVDDFPRSVAVGDVNGDGILDLVTSNASSLSVLIGRGGGAFAAAVDLAVSGDPEAVELGDLDGDGNLDIAAAVSGHDRIAVFLGSGDGQFQARYEYAAGDEPFVIRLLDSDGDGDLDVVTGNAADASLSVLENDGDGAFPGRAFYVGPEPRSVVAGDVNGDGIADLVSASEDDGSLSILLGTAEGDYQRAVDIPLTVTGTKPIGSAGRRFTYDPQFHQMTSVTDDLGRRTLFEIDPANGNRLSTTEVVGELDSESDETDDLVTRFTYTAEGLVDTIVDPLGRITDNDYDSYGRLVTITVAVGTSDQASQHFEYDAAGNITAIIDENGARAEFSYDSLNRVTESRDADPDGTGPLESPVTVLEYDPRGNVTRVVDAEGSESTTLYDAQDRPIEVTDATGETTRFEYDAGGNLSRTIDPLGAVTSHRYDARNRLVETVDPAGGRTTFRYDADNNLTQVTDPVGNVTRFGYDLRDRLVRETDALGKSIVNDYDAADNLIRRTDRNGRATEYVYDDLNRLIAETWVGSGAESENEIDYVYDGASNLLSITDAFSSLEFIYDARDRVTRVDSAGTPGAPEVSLQYTHDAVGNVRSVTDTVDGTAGATTEYVYDALNRATRLSQSGSGVADKRVELAYNSLGQLASIDRFADLSGDTLVAATDYTYDALNRLADLRHRNGSEDIAFYEFTYDVDSRITSIRDIDGLTTYSYDATDQLIGAARGDGDIRGDESYQYDANGNRVASHLHGESYVTGLGNRLLSDGTFDYEYEGEGNLVRRTEISSGDYREFVWDHRNRLTSVTDKLSDGTPTQRVEFRYDALDRRISKAVDTTPADAVDAAITHFAYDREDVILDFVDTDGAGPAEPSLDKRYFHGPGIDQVFAQEGSTADVQWLLGDHLNSVRNIVHQVTGQLVSILYDTFGIPVDAATIESTTRFGFTSREYISHLGTYHYRARDYDSAIGRFISEDPIRHASGDPNLYRYVENAPVSMVDPSGHKGASSSCDINLNDYGGPLVKTAEGPTLKDKVKDKIKDWFPLPGLDPDVYSVPNGRIDPKTGLEQSDTIINILTIPTGGPD
ncbi:FG-GAP-like repeat-containing protein [Candidatus Laterigemmans baculatus]|uniref:FG-GAP-like repeat-containing protein n=1 Tax=Candidatus Laterigemmans baculatus TaxID=2770505 RepID=UPI0013D9C568|nr:FG-GAP-like repeat-containing protein [Candidatus Laterigemmans baculatus]